MTASASVTNRHSRATARRKACAKSARHKTVCVLPKVEMVPIKPLKAWAFIVEIKGKGYINWTSIAMTRRGVLAQHNAAIDAKRHIVPILITPLAVLGRRNP